MSTDPEQPALSHAEVEALREGKSECVRRLYAANAEIARLKNPYLVTVRREDLANVLAWAAENVAMKRIEIEQMEEAAR